MSLIIAADERLTRHLALALASHLRWCRRNAVEAPAELGNLLATLEARSGQERPKSQDPAGIRDGLCVNYSTAARTLGVSERTVRRMASDGRLTVIPVGRRRLVLVDELRRLTDAA
jgi:excisionase family DNA binding protein